MTIYNTAYDTTACSGYVLDRISKEVNAALISGTLTIPNPAIAAVQETHATLAAVPSFAHPVALVTNFRHQGATPEVKVAVDLRPFGKHDRLHGKFFITNPTEYSLNLLRARLTLQWLDDVLVHKTVPNYQRDISPLPMAVYSSWLSEALSTNRSLQPTEQYRLQILAAAFYASLFTNESKWEEADKLRISGTISRALKVSQPDVLDVLDVVEKENLVLEDIEDFCKAAAVVTGSLRMAELTPAVVFSVVGASWFGTNAREWVHAALEHPPTWIALVYAAATERGYRNSGIGRIVDRSGNRRYAEDFVPNMVRFINDRVPVVVGA